MDRTADYTLQATDGALERTDAERRAVWERKRFQLQAESCMVGFSGSKAVGFGSLKSCLCGSDSQQMVGVGITSS